MTSDAYFPEAPLSVNWARTGEHYGTREDQFWKPGNYRMRRDTGATWMLLQNSPVAPAALIDTEKLVFRVIICPPAFKTEILIL
jgi:hypothetical protein